MYELLKRTVHLKISFYVTTSRNEEGDMRSYLYQLNNEVLGMYYIIENKTKLLFIFIHVLQTF